MSVTLTEPSLGSAGWGAVLNQALTDLQNAVNARVLTTGGGQSAFLDITSTGLATLDLSKGNLFRVTLSADTSLATSNPPPSAVVCMIDLLLVQDATGGRTLSSWLIGTSWLGGVAPTLSTAPGAVDWVRLVSLDGGEHWYGLFWQPDNPDLSTLAALDATQSGVIASDGAGWLVKSFSALKAALGITPADVSGFDAAAVQAGSGSYVPLAETADAGSGITASRVLKPATDNSTGLLIVGPDATWGSGEPYGHGNAIVVLGSDTAPTQTSPSSMAFRVDAMGGIGSSGGLHIMPGLLPGTDSAANVNEAAWLQLNGGADPATKGLVITDSATATANKDLLLVQDGNFNSLVRLTGAGAVWAKNKVQIGGTYTDEALIALSITPINTGQYGIAITAPAGYAAVPILVQVNSVNVFQVLASGQIQTAAANEATGSGTASLGANCPATTASAPYKWEKITTSDGSQGYFPVWK